MDNASKEAILIVDDEADIRAVLAIALQDMGFGTMEAENAAQAFALFTERHPRIVITDIKMPGGDGIDLLRKIKRENPETEVIMITGHGDMDLAIRSLKHQATDFITKPIHVEALEIALNRARERILTRGQLQAYTRSLEQLVREKTQLQGHLASLGLMIGSISHGLKNLLTALDGGHYLIQSGLRGQDLERAAEGYRAARQTAERIRKMVLDILYCAKERDLERAPVRAAALAQGLVRAIQPRIDEYGIDLVCDFDDRATLEADADILHAALINILDNAVDACLKAPPQPPRRIDFSVAVEGQVVVFSIADNGIGMESETLEKIFALFYSTKESKGTGLGLFIAKRIVHQHGGTIAVVSTPGQGARFTVKIPRTAPPPPLAP